MSCPKQNIQIDTHDWQITHDVKKITALTADINEIYFTTHSICTVFAKNKQSLLVDSCHIKTNQTKLFHAYFVLLVQQGFFIIEEYWQQTQGSHSLIDFTQ